MTGTDATRPLWTTLSRRPTAQLRMVCFPCAGGGAGMFSGVPSLVPEHVETVALQLPGRENRLSEKPLHNMADIVQLITSSPLLREPVPFAFFGYSLGALIAFETTRALRRAGRTMPVRLFAAASTAPQSVPRVDPPLYSMPEEQFLDGMRRYQGVPEALLANAEFMKLLLPMFRADFQVLETYRAADEPPLDVPLTAYGGLSDPEIEPADVAAWGEQTSAGFTLQFFPGDHFFIRTAAEPLFAAVARELESV